MTGASLPLDGVRVLDLSTLLPGPMATLLLSEAGAEVTKVERPGQGDEMRAYEPKIGDDSANFVLLNRGKDSITLDLRTEQGRDGLLARARDADVWVEQNRPGVMDRLGVGYEDVRAVNPAIIYCSITGYGQQGPDAGRAGHDLTYLAESGLLGDAADSSTGAPHLPPTVIADIAGGTYPAVINILLALMQRERTGAGAYLDISMTHNLHALAYSSVAARAAGEDWPAPGKGLLTGGSPRYAIYRTADDRYLAAAPLEQRFWERFTELIGLAEQWRTDGGQEEDVRDEVARLVRGRTAAEWEQAFVGADVCCSVVATFAEAEAAQRLRIDPEHRVAGAGGPDVPALGVPLSARLRRAPGTLAAPGSASPLRPRAG